MASDCEKPFPEMNTAFQSSYLLNPAPQNLNPKSNLRKQKSQGKNPVINNDFEFII
jgi:hypothetical protein